MSAATGYTDRRAPSGPSAAGIVLTFLLTTAFAVTCVLKLCGVVAWSWALILSPIWLPLAVAYVFVALALLLVVRK